jgi:cytochrome c oxidase subunit 2
MGDWIPFWPQTATVGGEAVNNIFIAELGLCLVIVLTVVGLMLNFVLRYHHGSRASRANLVHATWHYEIGWTSATLLAFLVLFIVGADFYVWLYKSPPADIEMFVVGKQWMWKVQHPGGQREIDQLHVPVGQRIRLVIASQDVVHSFFVPAFRIKRDAVPGTYTTVWFKATKPGVYRLECSEFCGTEHVKMRGEIVVMEPAAYADWLALRGVHESLAQQGEQLFRQLGCSGCHFPKSDVHAPSLVGLYGRMVHLMDGTTVIADRQYIMDSILLPKKQVAAGYAPIMPSFAGQVGEDDLMKLLSYIESLSPGTR